MQRIFLHHKFDEIEGKITLFNAGTEIFSQIKDLEQEVDILNKSLPTILSHLENPPPDTLLHQKVDDLLDLTQSLAKKLDGLWAKMENLHLDSILIRSRSLEEGLPKLVEGQDNILR